jgi:hypothetical protein
MGLQHAVVPPERLAPEVSLQYLHGRRRRPLILPPPYLSLSGNQAERQQAYRAPFMATVAPDDSDAIRRHVQWQHADGSNRFRVTIEAQLGRPAGPRKIGWPKKSDQTLHNRKWPLWPPFPDPRFRGSGWPKLLI